MPNSLLVLSQTCRKQKTATLLIFFMKHSMEGGGVENIPTSSNYYSQEIPTHYDYYSSQSEEKKREFNCVIYILNISSILLLLLL